MDMRGLDMVATGVFAGLFALVTIMGFFASLVGLFLGLGLAKFLFWLFGEVGFTLPNTGLLFKTRTIVVCLVVGTLVTMLASLRPARRATRESGSASIKR